MCDYDWISLRSGNSTLGKFCGSSKTNRTHHKKLPREYSVSPTNQVTLTFHTDYSNEEPYSGFRAHYIAVGKPLDNISSNHPSTHLCSSSLPPSLPSFLPSFHPFILPFILPSFHPSFLPSFHPSFLPSSFPSFLPSFHPSILPSFHPSFLLPTLRPSFLPSFLPSFFPFFVRYSFIIYLCDNSSFVSELHKMYRMLKGMLGEFLYS